MSSVSFKGQLQECFYIQETHCWCCTLTKNVTKHWTHTLYFSSLNLFLFSPKSFFCANIFYEVSRYNKYNIATIRLNHCIFIFIILILIKKTILAVTPHVHLWVFTNIKPTKIIKKSLSTLTAHWKKWQFWISKVSVLQCWYFLDVQCYSLTATIYFFRICMYVSEYMCHVSSNDFCPRSDIWILRGWKLQFQCHVWGRLGDSIHQQLQLWNEQRSGFTLSLLFLFFLTVRLSVVLVPHPLLSSLQPGPAQHRLTVWLQSDVPHPGPSKRMQRSIFPRVRRRERWDASGVMDEHKNVAACAICIQACSSFSYETISVFQCHACLHLCPLKGLWEKNADACDNLK